MLHAMYMKVLGQVEKHGWRAVKWKNNYTLLHFAASSDSPAFCKYLLALGADADVKDKHSLRSPPDLLIFVFVLICGGKIELTFECFCFC